MHNKNIICQSLNIIIILYVIIKIVTISRYNILDLNSWAVSEFFVNFEGGFVRRGLVGQLLYYFVFYTGLDPRLVIIPICIGCFIFILCKLFSYLQKNQLWWWILALSFCFGNIEDFLIRKDMINLSLMVGCFYIYSKQDVSSKLKIISVSLLSVLILLVNEAAFFFFMPFMMIVILKDKSLNVVLVYRMIYPFLTIFTMMLLVAFTANTSIPLLIDQSWKNIMPNYLPGEIAPTVEAMSWSTEHALEYNKSIVLELLSSKDSISWNMVLSKIFLWFIIPYFLVLYPYTMKKKAENLFPFQLPSFIIVVSIQFISILPLLLGLSCDYDRCFMYIMIDV